MSDQSPKSNAKTSRGSSNIISSPASADGPSRSELQDGQTTDLFGAPVVHAPRSPSPASKRRALSAKAHVLCGALDELATQYAQTAKTLGLPMPATYGRKFGDSPLNTALDTSSESRLTALLPLIGSPLYQHRLKYSATPLGRRVYQLRASEHRTSGSGFGGWPTPNDAGTPAVYRTATTNAGNTDSGTEDGLQLVSGWPTPTARRHRSGSATAVHEKRDAHPRGSPKVRIGAMPNSSRRKRGLLTGVFPLAHGFPANREIRAGRDSRKSRRNLSRRFFAGRSGATLSLLGRRLALSESRRRPYCRGRTRATPASIGTGERGRIWRTVAPWLPQGAAAEVRDTALTGKPTTPVRQPGSLQGSDGRMGLSGSGRRAGERATAKAQGSV